MGLLGWLNEQKAEIDRKSQAVDVSAERVEKPTLGELQMQWCDDPCWDLEETEGFEEYRAELKAFADARKAEWAAQRNEKLTALAEKMGCPGNMQAAEYALGLERVIERLEDDLRRIRDDFGIPRHSGRED